MLPTFRFGGKPGIDEHENNPMLIFQRPRRAWIHPNGLMAVLARLSVLAAIVVARAAGVKEKAGLARCTANLQQINRAVLTFCDDNDQTLPGPADTAPDNVWWWYKEQVKDYLG